MLLSFGPSAGTTANQQPAHLLSINSTGPCWQWWCRHRAAKTSAPVIPAYTEESGEITSTWALAHTHSSCVWEKKSHAQRHTADPWRTHYSFKIIQINQSGKHEMSPEIFKHGGDKLEDCYVDYENSLRSDLLRKLWMWLQMLMAERFQPNVCVCVCVFEYMVFKCESMCECLHVPQRALCALSWIFGGSSSPQAAWCQQLCDNIYIMFA